MTPRKPWRFTNTNTEDKKLLDTLQLSDSFFPSGLYAMSNGLESMFYRKKLGSAADLQKLMVVYLEQQIGPADCSALGNSYKFAQENDLTKVMEIDRLMFCMKPVGEIRNASVRSGAQMLQCVKSFVNSRKILDEYVKAVQNKQTSGIYPVALGVASLSLGISKHNSGISMLYSFCAGMVGAALRLGILNHFDAQKIIHNLKPTICQTAAKNIDRPLSGLWQFAPQIEIFQMEHEHTDSKMFIT